MSIWGRVISCGPALIKSSTHNGTPKRQEPFSTCSAPTHARFRKAVFETLATALNHTAATHPTIGSHLQIVHPVLVMVKVTGLLQQVFSFSKLVFCQLGDG